MLYFGKEVTKYITIVRTNFPDYRDREKCKKDLEELLRENTSAQRMLSSVKGIIYVDNPPPKVAGFRRTFSRKLLLWYLNKLEGKYLPPNFAKLCDRIGDIMAGRVDFEDLPKDDKEKIGVEVKNLIERVIQNPLQNDSNFMNDACNLITYCSSIGGAAGLMAEVAIGGVTGGAITATSAVVGGIAGILLASAIWVVRKTMNLFGLNLQS